MLGWLKGLSVTGRVIFGILSLSTIGAIASADTKPPDTQTAKPESSQVQPKEQKPTLEQKTVTETEAVAFAKTTVDDGALAKGKTQLRIAGVNGVKTKTYQLTLEDGKEKDKKLVKEEVTTQPVTEVTAVGTYVYVAPAPVSTPKPASNCNPNYSPCVPNVSYDLDCPDIGFRVTVVGSDPYRLDGDHDGYGCDSY